MFSNVHITPVSNTIRQLAEFNRLKIQNINANIVTRTRNVIDFVEFVTAFNVKYNIYYMDIRVLIVR